MRRILVGSVRKKQTVKHGGGHRRIELTETDLMTKHDPDAFPILNDAVDRLSAENPAAGEITKLRLFGGLSVDEAVEMLSVPHTTA